MSPVIWIVLQDIPIYMFDCRLHLSPILLICLVSQEQAAKEAAAAAAFKDLSGASDEMRSAQELAAAANAAVAKSREVNILLFSISLLCGTIGDPRFMYMVGLVGRDM